MRTKKRGRETGTGIWDLGSRVGLSCWSCAYDRDSCLVSSRGKQSAPAVCRSCTQPLLRTGPALSDVHTEPRKTCSRVRGFCSSAVMKREFVQPHARQNSEFTDETVFKVALSRYSVIFCAILLWGKIMAAVRFSIVAVLRAIRLCVDDRLDADSSVVRSCNFIGTHAGIDPASPAVVEASV